MNITEKLALLKKEAAKIDKKYKSAPKNKNQKKLSAYCQNLLPGFMEDETGGQKMFYRDTFYSLNHKHGGIYLRELPETPSDVIHFLSQGTINDNLDLRKSLFLDIETTGLAGGTGTLAFLIGAGFFKEDKFIIRQYFIPDFSYEYAMLLHLNALMEKYPHLVTFNGQTFDFPLIMTRMTMNRIKPAVPEPVHLDLLHPARRLWKKTIGSCSLTSLEREILGEFRQGDVPGALIPQMYFNYLRNQNFELMEKVLFHNMQDIMSMASLIVKMWSHIEMAECGGLRCSEYYSLAKIYEKRGNYNLAVRYYEKARKSGNVIIRHNASEALSSIYKKNKEWDKAVALWEEMAEEKRMDVSSYVELSKYYEHTTRDVEKALLWAEAALEIVYMKRNLGAVSISFYKDRDDLLKRITRLRKKVKALVTNCKNSS